MFIDQSVDGKDFKCIDCLSRSNDDINQCKEECIIDHIFITTGQSDDVQSWISLELQIDSELKLPNLKHPSSIIEQSVNKIEICDQNNKNDCYQYMHIKLYRPYENSKNDKFDFETSQNYRACFSWITSDPSEGAFVTAVKASQVKYFGTVCTETKQADHICIYDDENAIIMDHQFPLNEFMIPDNHCKENDLSLVILMDLSDSIDSHSMHIGKQWIAQTIDYGKQLMSKNNLNFRSSLITFSSKTNLVWNLNDDQQNINDKLNNLDRPHDVLLEPGLTFTKDALNTVVNQVIPLKNSENDQILVVILTDGLPSNQDQNPCFNSEISDIFHSKDIRTVVVGIETGNTFNTAPYQCLYYPYSADISFVGIEHYSLLLGYQLHPIIKDAAFPTTTCHFNPNLEIPSALIGPQVHPNIVDVDDIDHIHDTDNNNNDHYETMDTCSATEEYIPIKKFVTDQYHECDQGTTEWRLELIDWIYHQHHDKTEYKYSICTSHLKPLNHCKVFNPDNNDNEDSERLKNIALQMPCDCEICIGYAVDDMEPMGHFGQV